MQTERLRRYTKLEYLLDILEHRRLTLVDPSSWPDTNDSHYVRLYKTSLGLASLHVLCFTDSHESYAIWRVFAGDSDGVCIEFHKPALVGYLRKDKHIICRKVQYVTKKKMSGKGVEAFADLPFIKRWGFITEHEFRAIYQDANPSRGLPHVKIGTDCIASITFSPWTPESDYHASRQRIRKIDGCKTIRVSRTTLIDDGAWKTYGDRIAESYCERHKAT